MEQMEIKPLGDVITWGLRVVLTTVAGTGTFVADGGTPSGAFRGTNLCKLINNFEIKDKQNNDIFVAAGQDLWVNAYLLSCIDIDDLLFKRGLDQRADISPTDTGSVTSVVRFVTVPQRIKMSDLPAKVNVRLGTLDDYYDSVGTGTATINTFELWVRYMPPSAKGGFTERVKAFNLTAFSADLDVAKDIPSGINIQLLAHTLGNINALTAPAEQNEDRFDTVTFRRGSGSEIEKQDERTLHFYATHKFFSARHAGLYIVPTDAFRKTEATFWEFDINAQVAPRVYYIYI